ncbi:elongation factor G [Bryobacterales bacterium F-183]|nr:elongation factor G [Bryobacterales bacterium F-183]
MKVYEGIDVRNVALVGHGHAGKTSLAAGLLYTSGATNRLTRVDEGNTITDFEDEEIARKITVTTSAAFAEWSKRKINLLDTPGFNIFMIDTKTAMAAADSALVVVDGVAGVEVQTERVWGYADEFELPRAVVINKLDRERSSFSRALESVQNAFGRAAVPVEIPIGSERDFRGVIDLIAMKAYEYDNDGNGKAREVPIPEHMQSSSDNWHAALVEMIAEGNDALMEEFFEQGTLPVEHLVDGLRAAVRERRLFPVLCVSAQRNVGSDRVLDFCAEYFPSPVERSEMSDKEAPAAFVYKTIADPFAGRVTYFKVMRGVVRNDGHLINSRSGVDERLAHVGCLMGKTLQPVPELHAGDLGAVAKLRDTLTWDTLADKSAPIAYPKVEVPEPSIAYAISAKTRNDEDKMGNAIHKILEEDPALRFYRDPQTKEFLLAGNGQQHIEVVCSKLRKRYHVDVELHAPKIPYRETIRGRADVHGRHKKQTGGHGQFGDCKIRVEPLERGAKFQFSNEIFGGAIPRQFVPAVEKGILEAAERGYLAGYPMVDFKVVLYDGSYHDVDSNEMSFKMAGRKAFRLAMEQAKPALLEPVMRVEVQAPVEYAGDLMGDMNSRRGRIAGMDVKGSTQVIKAMVPMSEMLTYQNDLISMTQGRASFSMEFDHYDFVPGMQAEKVIAAAKAAGVGVAADEDE